MYYLEWQFANGKKGIKSFTKQMTKSQQALWISNNLSKDLKQNYGKISWKFIKY